MLSLRLLAAGLFVPAVGVLAQANPEPLLRCISLGAGDRPLGRSQPDISADGRIVAYLASSVPSLHDARPAPGEILDIVHVADLQVGESRRVPVEADGARWWLEPAMALRISADGRTGVVTGMHSIAGKGSQRPQLVTRAFVLDLVSGTARSVEFDEGTPPLSTFGFSLSADGKYLLQQTTADFGRGIGTADARLLVHRIEDGETRSLGVDDSSLPVQRASCSGDGGIIVLSQPAATDDVEAVCLGLHIWRAEDPVLRPLNVGPGPHVDAKLAAMPTLSADGCWLAFISNASDLVPDDTNGVADVFLLELATGAITRCTVASDGQQADAGPESYLSLSSDGRYVAFRSDARGLVPDDTNDLADAFVHDRLSGQTQRVSTTADGRQADGKCVGVRISGDGQWVVLATEASLLPEDDIAGTDIYVRHVEWAADEASDK